MFSSTDTELEFALVTMRSGRPSPLTSAAATETGKFPVPKVCWAAKLGIVRARGRQVDEHPDRVLTIAGKDDVRPAITVHVRRSHRVGRFAGGKETRAAKLAAVAPGAVVFNSTDTVLSKMSATTRSGRPSPFTSAVVTEIGWRQ